VLETGAAVAAAEQEQLVATPSVRAQETVASEHNQESQGHFSPMPAAVAAAVAPIATHQHQAEQVVTAVAETAQRPRIPHHHVCR
jgi:hypothetical protein